MDTANTTFTMIEGVLHGQRLAACPLCGSPSQMWERAEGDKAAKAVCCSHGEALASMPHDGLAYEGCPLFSPPEGFYRATYREAAKTWNDACAEFVQMRASAADALLDAARRLERRGFFAPSPCADAETAADMALMRAALGIAPPPSRGHQS